MPSYKLKQNGRVRFLSWTPISSLFHARVMLINSTFTFHYRAIHHLYSLITVCSDKIKPVIEGNTYEARQISLIFFFCYYLLLLLFGLNRIRNTIVVYFHLQNKQIERFRLPFVVHSVRLREQNKKLSTLVDFQHN